MKLTEQEINEVIRGLRKTQAEKIEDYFIERNESAKLEEIYEAFPEFPAPSIRRILRRDSKKRFINIARGIYFLNNGEAQAVLLEADSRNLDFLEADSIDLIISDHPWKDDKALKGGTRDFTKGYGTTNFKYEQEDFDQKARVLKKGAYLVELLPTESATNFDYLYNIKKMAETAGFKYYAKIMWQKNPSNTGRTIKEFEDIMIFSKGEARRINDGSRKQPYKTREMLQQKFYAPVAKSMKFKNHQAEKPKELFCYLIEMLTEPFDIVLDQFGGACNTIQAALESNRYILAFEIIQEYVEKAVARFSMTPICLLNN